ncbi:MAG: flp pilus-assembly TadE/G-like family protein [Candidatus Ancillula sp.]|nr:flp pilus-assembly TadE/G-like family protein [Candidatus Ancillula sp.]
MKSDERGSGSVLTLGILALSVMVTLALSGGVGLVSKRNSLQDVADLVAISGATFRAYALDGCEIAREVAIANEASLSSCDIDGMDVQVRISSNTFPPLHATSKAGPGVGCG